MEQTDLARIEQQINEFEIYKRAGEAAEQLIRVVLSSPYEDLDSQIATSLNCTLTEAKTVRHLTLDRLSPQKIGRISEELEALRQQYARQKPM